MPYLLIGISILILLPWYLSALIVVCLVGYIMFLLLGLYLCYSPKYRNSGE